MSENVVKPTMTPIQALRAAFVRGVDVATGQLSIATEEQVEEIFCEWLIEFTKDHPEILREAEVDRESAKTSGQKIISTAVWVNRKKA